MKNADPNKSTLDVLTEYAVQTHRPIFKTEEAYPTSASDLASYHKRTVYIPATSANKCFLVGFSDYKSFTKNSLFFGVFFPLSTTTTNNLLIRKKDFLDCLNFSLRKNKIRTGNTGLDSHVVITGNDRDLAATIQKNMGAPQLIRDILSIEQNINIGLNECNMDFVPPFNGSSHFGVFTRQKWILDEAIIEELFSKTESLRQIIQK